jgi:hypothetical protein
MNLRRISIRWTAAIFIAGLIGLLAYPWLSNEYANYRAWVRYWPGCRRAQTDEQRQNAEAQRQYAEAKREYDKAEQEWGAESKRRYEAGELPPGIDRNDKLLAAGFIPMWPGGPSPPFPPIIHAVRSCGWEAWW